MNWFVAAGVVMQVIGVAATGFGAARTWRAFAPEGERFADPAVRWARERWTSSVSMATRLYWRLRGGRSVRVVAGTASLVTGGGSVKARGRAGYPPLSAEMPVSEALTELDRRVRQQVERLADLADRTEDSIEAIRGDLATLSDGLGEAVERLERQDRRIAVGGIRLEAVGLTLIAGGVLLQGLGSL